MDAALHIANHPRNARVSYCGPPRRCYCVDKRWPMRGVHAVIDKFYVPYAKRALRNRLPRNVRANATQGAECGGNSALDHGVNVDRDIDLYVNLCMAARAHVSNARWRAAVLAQYKRCRDPCSERIVHFLSKRRWLPLRTQQCIYDSELRIATAIDILCVDLRTNAPIIVELKTTFHDDHHAYYESAATDGAQLRHVPATPYSYVNADLLQLYLTTLIVRRNYTAPGSSAAPRGYLVRIASSGGAIAVYSVDEAWFDAANCDAALAPLLLTTNGTNAARKRKRTNTADATPRNPPAVKRRRRAARKV